LVIGKASAAVTLGNLSQTYNGTPRAVSTGTTPGGLATAVTYDGNTTPPTNAGSYVVAASVTDANYTGSAGGTLVIGQAAASLSLGDLNQTYTGSARVVTVNTTPAGVAVAVTYNGSATAPVNAGTYAISATSIDPNYAGSATGSLTVAKAAASVTLANLVQTYTGTPRPVTVTSLPAGLAVAVTYNGSVTAPTNPGAYSVVATVTDANYAGAASGTLNISVNLQASALTRTSSGPATSVNNDAAAPGGTWVRLASTNNNQWIQFNTGSIPAGTYQLQLVYRTGSNHGTHSVKMDGNTVGGTIDQYASTATYQTVTVGNVVFSSTGSHTVRLTTNGKNSAASSRNLSAVRIILNKL
jgi:hypothetical protein